MKQHHFLFIALSVICILIIPKQTFAQEVLTKVNGGASWETPVDNNTTYTAGVGLELNGTEFRKLYATQTAASSMNTAWNSVSDVILIPDNISPGNLTIARGNTPVVAGQIVTVVNNYNNNFNLCCSTNIGGPETYIALDGNTRDWFPANSSTTLMYNGTTTTMVQIR